MNVKKLTHWNMQHDINSRLHVETIQDLTEVYRIRGNAVAMLATIHREIDPALIANRHADDLLERTLRDSHEKQGYSVTTGDKYNGQVYSIGTVRNMESNLASENSPFAGILAKGMDKARSETYQASK